MRRRSVRPCAREREGGGEHLLPSHNASSGVGAGRERAPLAEPVADGGDVGAGTRAEQEVPRNAELIRVAPFDALRRRQPLLALHQLSTCSDSSKESVSLCERRAVVLALLTYTKCVDCFHLGRIFGRK